MRALTRCAPVALSCLLAAACSNGNNSSSTSPTTPSCTVTAAAGTTSFAAAGGTGTVTVTAGSGCAWTATSGASFVTITAGSTGSGNGTVSFTVAANTGAARTGTVTVAGTAFTVSQSAAAPALTGTLSAPTDNSPVGGVSVSNGNPTLVVNNAGATGTVGTVTYHFEVSDQPTFPNDPARTFTVDNVPQGSGSTTSWTVTRTLGNDVLWYWHARATNGVVTSDFSPTDTFRTPSSCTISVSPTSVSVGSSGGTATITITASTTTCAWTVTTSDSSVTPSALSGTGSGSVTLTIAANTGAARTPTVTIGGQTISISQSAGSSAISASFKMRDPALSGSASVTNCTIEPGTGTVGSTCFVDSTSFPLGTAGLVNFSWTVSFFDGQTQTFTQNGANTSFPFTWTCGGPSSAAPPGAAQPLTVTLTVTDSLGNSTTVTSGTGSQPAMTITLNKC